MQLTKNTSTENHLLLIKQMIKEAQEIFIAVAFFKSSGLRLLEKEFKIALARNAKLTIICGLDFYQTEPEALKKMRTLVQQYENCKLLIYKQKDNTTFHPKLYWFKTEFEQFAIVGSANFTEGGLKNNFELSLSYSIRNNPALEVQISTLMESLIRNAIVLDDIELSSYTRKYQIHKKNENIAKREVENQINSVKKLDLNLIETFLRDYLNDTKEQENFSFRKANYYEAKSILEKIRTENLNANLFYENYEKLVGTSGVKSLWHSGSIYRGKAKVKKNYLEFQSMLNAIYNNLDKSPLELFKLTEKYFKLGSADKISGVGINIITEIFNTYASEKFAVLNQNPLTSIKACGFEEFPHSQSFKADNYEDFCNLLVSLMNVSNFESLGQTDHFLNFIYWRVKDNPKPPKTNPNSTLA